MVETLEQAGYEVVDVLENGTYLLKNTLTHTPVYELYGVYVPPKGYTVHNKCTLLVDGVELEYLSTVPRNEVEKYAHK